MSTLSSSSELVLPSVATVVGSICIMLSLLWIFQDGTLMWSIHVLLCSEGYLRVEAYLRSSLRKKVTIRDYISTMFSLYFRLISRGKLACEYHLKYTCRFRQW